MPIPMTKKPGPEHIMKIVKQLDATVLVTKCAPLSYVKNELSCISVCGHCHGLECADVGQDDVTD